VVLTNSRLPTVACQGLPRDDFLMVYAAGTDVALPGLIICRLAGSLFYANAESLMNEVLSLVRDAPSTFRSFITWPRKCSWSWLTGWQESKWH
jgi:hypothetical protein